MIVYIETNFLMAVATGREGNADALLALAPSVRILLPAICCMEALSTLDDERRRHNRFNDALDNQIAQLRRDVTSGSAKKILAHLENARVENAALWNDIQVRLTDLLHQVPEKIGLVPTIETTLRDALASALVLDDPTDNLILHSVLAHADADSDPQRYFLSENRRDYDVPAVRAALEAKGVTYVRSSAELLHAEV